MLMLCLVSIGFMRMMNIVAGRHSLKGSQSPKSRFGSQLSTQIAFAFALIGVLLGKRAGKSVGMYGREWNVCF